MSRKAARCARSSKAGTGAGRIAISEWPATRIPGFMVCDGRWKLLYGRAANAPSLDALYDLQTARTS